MKVALVACNASYVHTNLAVRCIARSLTLRGHEAVIIERSLKDRRREFLTALYEADADVYGFSTYIWNRDTVLSLAADLHQIRPGAKIVFGGPEISFEDPSFFDRHPFVDNIIAGEGEDAFPDYCDNPPKKHEYYDPYDNQDGEIDQYDYILVKRAYFGTVTLLGN